MLAQYQNNKKAFGHSRQLDVRYTSYETLLLIELHCFHFDNMHSIPYSYDTNTMSVRKLSYLIVRQQPFKVRKGCFKCLNMKFKWIMNMVSPPESHFPPTLTCNLLHYDIPLNYIGRYQSSLHFPSSERDVLTCPVHHLYLFCLSYFLYIRLVPFLISIHIYSLSRACEIA